MRVKISDIKVGRRLRKETGDLNNLKKSLKKHGLLSPVLIDSKGELVAGYRRLCAAKELGWEEIDAITVDPKNNVERLEIEMEENIVRKEFTPDELMEGLKQKKSLTSTNIFVRIWNFIKRLFGIR